MLAVDLQNELRLVAQQQGLRLLIAFGSSVTTQLKPGDLDLAMLPLEGWLESPPAELWTNWSRALSRGDLDLIWLSSANWQLARQIALHGVPIYEAEPGCWRDVQVAIHLRVASSDAWRTLERNYLQRLVERRFELDTDLVRRKATLLGQYLQDLDGVLQGDSSSFELGAAHYAAERLVELLVECAAWINTEVAQSVAGIPPADYYSSFFSIARTGWIGDDTAQALAELARLRNALVHHYEDVPLKTLHTRLAASLPYWRAYLKSLVSRL